MFAPITRAYLHAPCWSPPLRGPRRALVKMLLRASALLVHSAVRLQLPADDALRRAPGPSVASSIDSPESPTLEFHAEAGAPEGALYVAGQLVGHLPGVSRL